MSYLPELQARLNTLLRRASGWTTPLLQCGPVTLDARAQVPCGAVDLTGFEYRRWRSDTAQAGRNPRQN